MFWAFFSQIHTIKTNFPNFLKKICSHSAKIHQEKSLLCTEFLLFSHSGFICYDRPCNFSLFVALETLILSKIISTPKNCKQLLMWKYNSV
jgi:hypothetical protein